MRQSLGTLFFSLILIVPLQVVADSARDQVTVMARGEVPVVPDQADISLAVSRTGDDVAKIQKTADRDVDRLVRHLLASGIPENDINSTSIRIQPLMRYDQTTQQRVSDGFQVDRTVRFTLEDLSMLGALISELSAMGVSNISPPTLSSSKEELAYREALSLAVKQGRERAAVLAEAAGRKLGEALNISTSGGAPRPPMPMARLSMAADSESAAYQPGEVTISADVTMTFGLDS